VDTAFGDRLHARRYQDRFRELAADLRGDGTVARELVRLVEATVILLVYRTDVGIVSSLVSAPEPRWSTSIESDAVRLRYYLLYILIKMSANHYTEVYVWTTE
jgi:hypothetical protein